MVDNMTARHLGEKTQKDYVRCVKNLAAFIGRVPETDAQTAASRAVVSAIPAANPPEQASRSSIRAWATERCGCPPT